jgi:acyl dehydratase
MTVALRTLESPPQILAAYARAAGSLVPGAGRLPFFPGHGETIPELERELPALAPDPGRLERYCEVCGFRWPRASLPVTFPHVAAFPLHLALMTDGRFPFSAIGLVHTENEITQTRAIAAGETLAVRVYATPLEPHRRGRTFTIVTQVSAGGQSVWRERSVMLRREGNSPEVVHTREPEPEPVAGTVEWELPGDLGRRYAAISGDRNPIHLNKYAAKALGFPRTLAHGMWTKARCLAALEDELPSALTASARFRKPVLLPRTVSFGFEQRGRATAFALHAERSPDVIHLEGSAEPLGTGHKAVGESSRERVKR